MHTNRLLPHLVLTGSRARFTSSWTRCRLSRTLFSAETSVPAPQHFSAELKQLSLAADPISRKRSLRFCRKSLVARARSAETNFIKFNKDHNFNNRKKNYMRVLARVNKDRRTQIMPAKKIKVKTRQPAQQHKTRQRITVNKLNTKKSSAARQATERLRSRWFKLVSTEANLLYSHTDWVAYLRRRKSPNVWRGVLLRRNHEVSLQKDLEKISEL